MSTLAQLLESLPDLDVNLESWGRTGRKVRELDGRQLWRAARAYRPRFATLREGERERVGLLFKSEETIEFLVAAFAAFSSGLTVVPLYPNWDADTQQLYLRRYNIRKVAVGAGFKSRVEAWCPDGIGHIGCPIDDCIEVSLDADLPASGDDEEATGKERDLFTADLAPDHPIAWIFTSGTSDDFAKCTEISLRNIEAAIENIRGLEFLRPGMCVHSPLSTSHIFAFVVILGFLAVRPRRVIFSDVQHLARLSEERIGKVDAIILVPIVLNRMRQGFYEKLTSDLSGSVPPELERLAKIPRRVRRGMKRLVRRAEDGLIALESGKLRGRLAVPTILAARKLFGRLFQKKLGSPDFVVIGGAKPGLESMALLEVMGVRVLQGWGMTETTGPLCVCDLRDRRRGAFGTCGDLFGNARARIEEDELVVEGPQIASGYVEPDGTLVPFGGEKRTGDRACFDRRARLQVLGKVSDRITTENGLNYFPIPMEDALEAADANAEGWFEKVLVIGDARPRLGAVFFPREGLERSEAVDRYAAELVRQYNLTRAVDERIGPFQVSDRSLREAGAIGPTGKVVRRIVEAEYAFIYGEVLV